MDDHDLDRIERYVAGDMAAAEAEAFSRWLDADPERRRLVEALKAGPTFDIDAMWRRVQPRVREHRRSLSLIARDSGQPRERRIGRRIPLAAAAALILCAVGVMTFANRVMRHPAVREFSTRRGERADVRLDDGTRIVLGAATTLRIPADYGVRARDVFLDGEAFFEVSHDAAHPFAVHVDSAVVRDVGTQFAVTAYDPGAAIRVVVMQGAVRVARVTLGPNDLALVAPDGAHADVQHHIDAGAALSWTHGRLVFQTAPFADVATSLSRWYDLDIQLADSELGGLPLTVSFGPERTREVLDALALLTHAQYTQHDRTVVFTLPHRPSAP